MKLFNLLILSGFIFSATAFAKSYGAASMPLCSHVQNKGVCLPDQLPAGTPVFSSWQCASTQAHKTDTYVRQNDGSFTWTRQFVCYGDALEYHKRLIPAGGIQAPADH